jgi:hypothetical protein
MMKQSTTLGMTFIVKEGWTTDHTIKLIETLASILERVPRLEAIHRYTKFDQGWRIELASYWPISPTETRYDQLLRYCQALAPHWITLHGADDDLPLEIIYDEKQHEERWNHSIMSWVRWCHWQEIINL